MFWGTSQTDWTSVYHTAIYVGGDQIVEATGDQVQLNSLGQWGSGDLMPNGRRPVEARARAGPDDRDHRH